jgi:hypothetical protein
MGRKKVCSITDFCQPRYHGKVGNPYPFPNDELEKERLDELQSCMLALIGANVVAPIGEKPTQIGNNPLSSSGF